MALAGCYQQPALPPDRPLRCSDSDAADECPSGYVCVAGRECALRSCRNNADCPSDLVCSQNRGCVLPGGPPDQDVGISAPGLMLDGRGDDVVTDGGLGGGQTRAVDAPVIPDGGSGGLGGVG